MPSLYDGDQALIDADPTLSPFPMVDDYNMIRWMQENIQGSPTIMEGRSSWRISLGSAGFDLNGLTIGEWLELPSAAAAHL